MTLRQPPLVSVVMPMHNAARFVAASVQSILAQTVADLELLVIDDGSTDGSAEIVARNADERVRVLRQERAGEGAARNAGVRESRGEFLLWQDADDISLPHRLETLLPSMDDATIGFAHSDMLAVDVDERPLGYWPTRGVPPHDLLRVLLREGSPFASISMLLRRKVLDGLRFDETLHVGTDTDLIRQFGRRWPGAHVPTPLVLYRRHAGSASGEGADVAPMLRKLLAGHPLPELVPEAYGSAIEVGDRNGVALAIAGLFVGRRGVRQLALELFNHAGEQVGSPSGRALVAVLFALLQGDVSQVLALLDELDFDHPLALHARGEALCLLGDRDAAYEVFLRLASDCPWASRRGEQPALPRERTWSEPRLLSSADWA